MRIALVALVERCDLLTVEDNESLVSAAAELLSSMSARYSR